MLLLFADSPVSLDPCEPPTDEDRMGGGLRKRQLVTQFDMATWRVSLPLLGDNMFPLITNTACHRSVQYY